MRRLTVLGSRYPTRYAGQYALLKTPAARIWIVVLAVAVLLFPHVASDFYTTIAVTVFLTSIGAVALNLLMGNAGLVSLGSAALLGVGAFVATYLANDLKLPFFLVLIGAGLGSSVAGAVVGAFTMRLRGLYIVMATFALHFIVLYAAGKYQTIRSGAGGFTMPLLKIGPWTINDLRSWYYVALVFAALVALVAANILRSSVGRSWGAMRERELAAQAMGIDVRRARVVAFTSTSFLFGVGGALSAYYIGNVSTDNFSLDVAIQYVAIIIIGGMGSLLGSFLGTIFVVTLPYIVTHAINVWLAGVPFADRLGQHTFEVQAGMYGVAIVAFMLLEPGGLATLWHSRLRRTISSFPLRRRWPVEA